VHRRLDITPVLLFLIASAMLGERHVLKVLSTVRFIHGGVSAKETPKKTRTPEVLAELERELGPNWLEEARRELGILD
jgi:hypothetical protein